MDNTNPTVEDRRALIEVGRRYGAKIVCYHFDSTLRECLGRNAHREGRARVPDVAIFATTKRLVPPFLAEGYDVLLCVRPGDDDFEVGAR